MLDSIFKKDIALTGVALCSHAIASKDTKFSERAIQYRLEGLNCLQALLK